MGNPHETAERLKQWEEKPLDGDLLATLREARECIEGLVADFDEMSKHYETQQREDDERQCGYDW